jgi:hypothetical protein
MTHAEPLRRARAFAEKRAPQWTGTRSTPLSSVIVGRPHSSQKWTVLSLERIATQLSRF